jgi:hypothetical protein
MVETALLLSLLGVILAVAVPTFMDNVRTSKIAEATEELGRIHHAAAAYYETPQPTASGKRLRCLPAPAGPTPALPSPEPVTLAFAAAGAPGGSTWRALRYEPVGAVRYRYSLLPAAAGCGEAARERHDPLLRIRAEGDLDGDGLLSLFERASSDRQGELTPRPMLTVHDRVE